jgi:hypothetical protein
MGQRASGDRPPDLRPGLKAVRQAFRSRWMNDSAPAPETSSHSQEIEYRHWVSAWMKGLGALDGEQAGSPDAPPPQIVRLQRPAEGLDPAVWLLTTEDGERSFFTAPQELRTRMPGASGYFEAVRTDDGWTIGKAVADQPW